MPHRLSYSPVSEYIPDDTSPEVIFDADEDDTSFSTASPLWTVVASDPSMSDIEPSSPQRRIKFEDEFNDTADESRTTLGTSDVADASSEGSLTFGGSRGAAPARRSDEALQAVELKAYESIRARRGGAPSFTIRQSSKTTPRSHSQHPSSSASDANTTWMMKALRSIKLNPRA